MIDEFDVSSTHRLQPITMVKLGIIGIYVIIAFIVLFLYIRNKSNKKLSQNFYVHFTHLQLICLQQCILL